MSYHSNGGWQYCNGNFTLKWPADYTGWWLQSQTSALAALEFRASCSISFGARIRKTLPARHDILN